MLLLASVNDVFLAQALQSERLAVVLPQLHLYRKREDCLKRVGRKWLQDCGSGYHRPVVGEISVL